ncbi:hypothetical protein TBLA_0I00710 [Henningerozyma blattae CBS 6284]|uniref:Mitochondrial intermediate peptidase n=1 Tax=Henningerozyma blattae (strain ATCC 34711 / CBS 6284 / DSM 70876 / NBRC 10599 / NRRL Y-10934 / UCD 77-7) TaxID=1071380 RepID=I2H8M7_HENB6|nr:hypothetical protein TBLA_0I00710 [Tetrapisispora blattae CBS 6284]CCH62729.1 hypothetical protein TBLA_0I00710 [Tetrapisispora blattae CBS 6284]
MRGSIALKKILNDSTSLYFQRFFKTSPVRNITRSNPLVSKDLKKQDLQKLFDDPKYFNSINNTGLNSNTSESTGNIISTGLFKNPFLTSPKGLKEFTHYSLLNASNILQQLKNDDTFNGLANYIIRLDQLSDTLCRVIDLCEFIRSCHPEKSFVQAAQECHEHMYAFMNTLNTDIALCDRLRTVLDNKEVLKRLTDEEIKVGKLLLEDFEKSGIQMSPEIRDRFISLSQDISLAGQDFLNNTSYTEKDYIKIKCDEFDKACDYPALKYKLSKDLSGKYYKIPTYGKIPYTALLKCKDEELRKKLWVAFHSCSNKQIERLTKIIKHRIELAKLLSKSSYSEYTLEGKMAKGPKEVNNFLNALLKSILPEVTKELEPISNKKCLSEGFSLETSEQSILNNIKPWDRDYYNPIQATSEGAYQMLIMEYFTLGNIIHGLSNLFNSIYGIRFEPGKIEDGETWSKDVRKLNVISEDEGLIGVIYCDLFEREGKSESPSHYTICCSREIYSEEHDLSTIQTGVNNKTGKNFQLPIVSLVCNFQVTNAKESRRICFLQHHEIETLFHEMGHAMHSMLGRTRFQTISGTRCVSDFVEIPSILMEFFANNPKVLIDISRHYDSGESIDIEVLNKYLENTKQFKACETYSQGKMALLDQRLHAENANSLDNIDVVEIYHNLEKELSVLPDTESNWCGRFGHLYGYGALYYCYLFDRAIATKIWESLFQNDPFSRKGGNIFKEQLLKWGGSKDPWKCVADVLGEPKLQFGGPEAMEYIGNSSKL